MSKNADFSETCFSQVNDVGLSMYVAYVVDDMMSLRNFYVNIITFWSS